MHRAAESGSSKACEVILNLRLDAVYDTDKKVFYIIATVTGTISKNSCSPPPLPTYINIIDVIFLSVNQANLPHLIER